MTATVAVMSHHQEQPETGAETSFTLRVGAAALAASLAAGATGLLLVLGRGLIELPGFAAVGLLYAFLPGMLTLALLHRFVARDLPAWRSLAAYAFFAALAAVVWSLPFVGLYVPLDRADALAEAGEMALYHAVSGAVGGVLFWFLTRRRRQTHAT